MTKHIGRSQIKKAETQEQARKRKNKAIEKIERRNETLENIMIREAGKGKRKDGRTPKALKALREFERNNKRISFIQFKT